MTGKVWALVLLLAVGCIAAVNHLGGARISVDNSQSSNTSLSNANTGPILHPTQTGTDPISSTIIGGDSGASEPQSTAATVAKLITDAGADDGDTRAVAIEALASVPKLQAIPALQKVLNSGVEEDRLLAVNSLRTLASQQGDVDGQIRNVLRLTIYDGDDETTASSAKVTLGDIEHEVEKNQKP